MPDYTRAELVDALRDRLGAAEGAARFWSDDALGLAVVEALRAWNRLTGYWRGRVAVPTFVGEAKVLLPQPLTWGARAEWLGETLAVYGHASLDLARPGWANEPVGVPDGWAPLGVTRILLLPAPAITSTALVIDGVLATPALAPATATVRLDEDLLPVVLGYARHLALFSLGVEVWRTSLGARAALWEAAGDYNQRLTGSDLYRQAVGRAEEAVVAPSRRGPRTIGAKARAADSAMSEVGG